MSRKHKLIDLKNLLVHTAQDHSIFMLFEAIEDVFPYAPASTKYHGNYWGGLLDHTLKVCHKASAIADLFDYPSITPVSIAKCALLHDLGKIGAVHDEPMFIVNPDFTKHDKEPFVYNNALVSLPHEQRTLKICHDLNIKLTDEEYQAICYHNGPYKINYMADVKKECALTVILHAADNLVAKLLNC